MSEVENPFHTMKDEPGQMSRPTPFSLLSQKAQDAIVAAACGDSPCVSLEVKEEVRKWADAPDEEVMSDAER